MRLSDLYRANPPTATLIAVMVGALIGLDHFWVSRLPIPQILWANTLLLVMWAVLGLLLYAQIRLARLEAARRRRWQAMWARWPERADLPERPYLKVS